MPTHLRGLTSSDRNTGLLNAQSLLSEGWTANLLYIQRQGPIVTLQSYRLQGPAGLILTFPSGFRPSTVGAVQFTWTGGAKTRYSNTELLSQEEGLVVGSSSFEMLQFLTNDGWPTAHGLPVQNPPVYN